MEHLNKRKPNLLFFWFCCRSYFMEDMRLENWKENKFQSKINVSTVYEIIKREQLETVTVDHSWRVRKESFDSWYASQDKFRNAQDWKMDKETLKKTVSMPEMARLLGIRRSNVYSILKSKQYDLAPSKERREEKSIWIRIPRGTIENYASYDDMVKWGEVENREEYEIRWKQDYPETDYWYELVVREAFHKDGTPWFRGVWLGDKTIVNPWIDQKEPETEEAVIEICALIAIAAEKAMEKVKEGTYNDEVRAFLPGYFHDEMIKDTDEEDKSAGTDGSKIQNPGIRGEYVFQRRMISRSANYNILCRWLTERFRVNNDQYAL